MKTFKRLSSWFKCNPLVVLSVRGSDTFYFMCFPQQVIGKIPFHKLCMRSLNAEVCVWREEQDSLIIKQFICQIRMPVQYIQYIRQSEYYQGKMLRQKTRVKMDLQTAWKVNNHSLYCNTHRYSEGFLTPRQQLNIHNWFLPSRKKNHNSLYTVECKIRLHIPTTSTTSKQEGHCCFTSSKEQDEPWYFLATPAPLDTFHFFSRGFFICSVQLWQRRRSCSPESFSFPLASQ